MSLLFLQVRRHLPAALPAVVVVLMVLAVLGKQRRVGVHRVDGQPGGRGVDGRRRDGGGGQVLAVVDLVELVDQVDLQYTSIIIIT